MEVSRDEWNHPRCWSEPSRYRLTGTWLFGSRAATAAQETPESHQTSRMSCSRRKSAPPQLAHFSPCVKWAGAWRYQASMPSFSNSSATRRMSAGETSGSLHFSQ